MLSSISVVQQILDDIKAKVTFIHQADFVHGDIRDANLMAEQKHERAVHAGRL
jgi:tRNA A-37 threonylcarbamoyl transferase component Bud32